MKKRLEEILVAYLKTELPNYSSMIVAGHTTKERPKPYICVDVSRITGHAGLSIEHGLLNATLTISIADSAHDIDYSTQDARLMDVIDKIEEFTHEGDDFVLNALTEFEEADAKSDSDLGNVVSYTAIIQVLDWDKVRGI